MRRLRVGGWRPLVPVVAALAGLLFAASATTAHGTELRSPGNVPLAAAVAQRQADVAQLTDQARTLREQVSGATARLAGTAGNGDAVIPRALRRAAGLTPVTGPALTVSLDDAPRPPAGSTLPGNPSPDDLVVHQQDVQGVVNALWAGGAQAMTIMGRRVVATTAVRCVGNTLLLYGRPYSPPFTVTAVGDPQRMRTALEADPDVQLFREYVAAYGLGYTVQRHASVTLPAYDGSLQLPHAEAAR